MVYTGSLNIWATSSPQKPLRIHYVINPRLQATHIKSDDLKPLKNTHHSLGKTTPRMLILIPSRTKLENSFWLISLTWLMHRSVKPPFYLSIKWLKQLQQKTKSCWDNLKQKNNWLIFQNNQLIFVSRQW